MPQIANLNVALTTTTGGFVRGMTLARGGIKGLRTSIIQAQLALALMQRAFSAVSAVARSTFAEIRETITRVDNIGDVAANIGVTTEELTRLRFAAKLSGAEAVQLDQGLKFLTKTLAAAARGEGESAKALNRMGLDARALMAMSPAQAFLEIAGAIEHLPNQFERSNAAVALFGRSAVDLNGTLARGKQGLMDLGAESDRLRGTVGTKMAAALSAADDSLVRFDAAMEGVKNRIVVQLAPGIDLAATALAQWAADSVGDTNTLGEGIDLVEQSVLFLTQSVEGLIAGWRAMKVAALESIGAINKGLGTAAGFVAEKLPGGSSGKAWASVLSAASTLAEPGIDKDIKKAVDEFWAGVIAGMIRETKLRAKAREKLTVPERRTLGEIPELASGGGRFAGAPGGAERGSVEALRAIAEADTRGKLTSLGQQQLAEEKKAVVLLAKIERSLAASSGFGGQSFDDGMEFAP